MAETLVRVTRKGQITVPVEIRRALGLSRGDKVALALTSEGQVTLRPVRSVADMTFGALRSHHRETLQESRQAFIDAVADEAATEGMPSRSVPK